MSPKLEYPEGEWSTFSALPPSVRRAVVSRDVETRCCGPAPAVACGCCDRFRCDCCGEHVTIESTGDRLRAR